MPSAFITGAATGIGAGLVSKLADENWQVFAGYRNSPPEAALWYGKPNVIAVKCDITSLEEVGAAARLVANTTGGKLDLLINNAGCFGSGGVLEAPDIDEYRKTFDINLFGVLNVLKALMPLIRNGQGPGDSKGRVINVASSSTFMTFPMASAYTVSKQALKTASMHLRLEMAPFDVQVTTLDPGAVETPMTGKQAGNAARQWAAIPGSLRQEYRAQFIDSETMMQNNKSVRLYTPERFADEVYRKIICRKRFKPLYVIGPGTAVMPWLHRLLPLQLIEYIWMKLFKKNS